MFMEAYVEELLLKLLERGYKGRIVSVQHLPEMKQEITDRFNQARAKMQFEWEHPGLSYGVRLKSKHYMTKCIT